MRLIFLAIDICLNNYQYLTARDDWHGDDAVDPQNLTCLNHLIALTEAKVVITCQQWKRKNLLDIRRVLTGQGFCGDIVGTTPELGKELHEEIQTWLDCTDYNIESFVVLDDDTDLGHLTRKLVKVSTETGLTMGHVQSASKILIGEKYASSNLG